MLFKEIIGQDTVKMKLIKSVKSNRVSHAQLFSGPEGCGILPLAIAYAQYISCENRQDDDACGRCASCVKYNRLIHPDLHFTFPVAHIKEATNDLTSSLFISQWREAVSQNSYMNLYQWLKIIGVENKQGIISAEESNVVIKKLLLKPYESEYKILIIWLPEKLHPAAANKLLKVLEEPPDNTLFILATHLINAVLKTIVSRTQIIKVPKIDDAALEKFLISKKGVSPEIAMKTARLANGNFLEITPQQEQGDTGSSDFELFRKWMQLAYKNNITSLTGFLDEITSLGREKQKKFLKYGSQILREAYIWNVAGGKLNRFSENEKDLIINLSPFLNMSTFKSFVEEFEKAYYHVERNVNQKFVFFDLSMKLCELIGNKSKITTSARH